MKRLIKYWSSYNETSFSDCSTKYEILPVLVDDSAGADELKRLAREHGYAYRTKVTEPKREGYRPNKITHSLKLSETLPMPQHSIRKDRRKMHVFLGFITLTTSQSDNAILPLNKGLNKRVTSKQANDIVNSQAFGVADVGTIGKENMIVMESWNYYHEIKLQGYSLESFEKHYGVDKTKNKGERYFSDSVSQCGECGEWDHQDDGYTYNFRVIGGDLLGINCGCFKEACKNSIEDFEDNTDTPMELEAAEELKKEGRLIFLERFIGGMVDGRGGSYGGKSTREGTPAGVLAEYKKKFPKASFVFTHDESGQFQTYFSIWKVKRHFENKSKAKGA